MKEFRLSAFVLIQTHLSDASENLKRQGDVCLKDIDTSRVLALANEVEEFAKDLRFDHAVGKAMFIKSKIEKIPHRYSAAQMGVHLEALKEDIEICMLSHEFVQVDQSVTKYLNAESLFGDKVLDAFPSARVDIQEAGNAIAVDLAGACVFHLMHVVEWGLRAFAKRFGFDEVTIDRKAGKTIPLAFSEWERILQQLPDCINKVTNEMPRGPSKQHAQETYYSALHDVRGFKDAWRNHVMHTRSLYSCADALAVWSHVERFMQNLALEGFSE